MIRTMPLLLAGTALVLTACGGGTPNGDTDTAAPPPAESPAGNTGTNDAAAPVPVTDATPAAPAEDTASEDRPDHTGTYPDGFTVEPEGQELALVGDDHVEVLYTLPDEGESVFRAAAVRPGSTRDDMTVVVVTSAEGMYDLRWLEIRDGQVGELRSFPDAYRMRPDLAARQALVPTVVWSPDGNTIAWVEPGDDGAVLRTVGWHAGPGTGRTADDNASFGLEGAPAVLQARSWEVAHSDGSQTVLTAESETGEGFRIQLERQADGAWAYHGLA